MRFYKKGLIAIALAAALTPLGAPPAAAEGDVNAIRAAMQNWQANQPSNPGDWGQTPGLIARWDDNGQQVTVDVGVRKPGGDPVTERRNVNDRFRAGSNTKMLMGVVTLILIDEGELQINDEPMSLDSSIPETLWDEFDSCNIFYKAQPGQPDSELCFDPEKITIRSLLQHTSGIESYDVVPDFMASIGADFMLGPNGPLRDGQYYLSQLLADGISKGPLFPTDCGRSSTDNVHCPDLPTNHPSLKNGFSYSNTNYVALAIILKHLTGDSYSQLITEKILQPLGMTGSKMPGSWHADEKTGLVRDLDTPHSEHWTGLRLVGQNPKDPTPLGPYNATRFNPTLAAAAGDLMSTTEDLIKFNRALVTGQLLSPARLQDMTSWYDLGYETTDYLAYKEAGDGADNDFDGKVDGADQGDPSIGDAPEADHPSVPGQIQTSYGLGLSKRTFDCPSVPGKSVTVYGHNGYNPGSLTYNYITPDGSKAMAFNLNADWPARLRPYKGMDSNGNFTVDLYWNYELAMMYEILRAGFC